MVDQQMHPWARNYSMQLHSMPYAAGELHPIGEALGSKRRDPESAAMFVSKRCLR